MKKKVIPVLMASIMLMSSVPTQAAWTTTNPTGVSPDSTQGTSYTGYSSMFTDVGGHWAQRFIEQWAANGIFGGMGDGTFSPNTNLTRAQFASVLKQLFDLQMVTEESFTDYRVPSDVSSSYWGREAIALCLDNGIMNLRNGSFAPEQPITREEVFFALGKAAKLDTLGVTGAAALNRFSDGYMVSSAAKDIVGKMVSLGMLAGRGNNMLEPQSTITRAEVSTILTQAIEFVTESKVRGESYSDAVIFSVDKGKDLTLENIKVNGNMFIKGSSIGNISLDNIDVDGSIFIYANSVDEINLTDVTNTDFIIICSDIVFNDNIDSNGNTFVFENAMRIAFAGEADSIEINGDFIDEVEVSGDSSSGIEEVSINGSNSDVYKVTLSGVIKEVTISGDSEITGYARVKTLYLDDGDYVSDMVGDTTKVLSGKLRVSGSTYNKGTYNRNEIPGAVIPNVSSNGDTTTLSQTYILNSNTVPRFYYSNTKDIAYITVNGSTLSKSNYTVNERTGCIEFLKSYLNSLYAGVYTVGLHYVGGSNDICALTIKDGSGETTADYTYVKGSASPNMYVNNIDSSVYNVIVDGYTLSTSEYYLSNGYLNISASYLNILSTGIHTVKCYFYNGNEVTFILRVMDYSSENTVTPRTVHHTKGSIYTTIHTYNSTSAPNYITIDGNVINNSYFTVNTYNRTIALGSAFVNTLSVGTHDMRVYFANGYFDDVSIVITDESQITSYIFDKTSTSQYYRNIDVSGISSTPTLIMIGDKVMPSTYYGYNSATETVVLYKEYFASLSTEEYKAVISYGNQSRTVNIIVQQSTASATFVYDKNPASVNHRDITLTGNISNSNLQVFVKNRQLNPNEFIYNSGSVTIFKSVFDTLSNSTCYVGVSSSSGTANATVNIIDTSM